MLLLALGGAALLLGGFGMGRVKNKAKLAAVSAELSKMETAGEADVKKVIAAIRAKL